MVEEELERIARQVEEGSEATRRLLKGYTEHAKSLMVAVGNLSKRVEKLERDKGLIGLN